MARPGITYQQVAAAADTITAEGENPTIKRIRAKLGDTGSPNTIHRHLTVWREAAPVQERKAPELPTDLQIAIIREIERQAAEARAELLQELTRTQAEAVELATTGERLETEIDELTDRNKHLGNEFQRMVSLAETRLLDINKLEDELIREREAAENARIQLAQALNKVELQDESILNFTTKLNDTETKLSQATTEKIAAEQIAAVTSAKLDASEKAIAVVQEDLDGIKTHSSAQAKELVTAVTAKTEAEKALAVALADLEGLNKRSSAQAEELTTAVTAKAEAEKALAISQSKIDDIKKESSKTKKAAPKKAASKKTATKSKTDNV